MITSTYISLYKKFTTQSESEMYDPTEVYSKYYTKNGHYSRMLPQIMTLKQGRFNIHIIFKEHIADGLVVVENRAKLNNYQSIIKRFEYKQTEGLDEEYEVLKQYQIPHTEEMSGILLGTACMAAVKTSYLIKRLHTECS